MGIIYQLIDTGLRMAKKKKVSNTLYTRFSWDKTNNLEKCQRLNMRRFLKLLGKWNRRKQLISDKT